jgi:hypothetical protein
MMNERMKVHLREIEYCRGVDSMEYLGVYEGDSLEDIFEQAKEVYRDKMSKWVDTFGWEGDDKSPAEIMEESIEEFSHIEGHEIVVMATDEGLAIEGVVVGEKGEDFQGEGHDKYGFGKVTDWHGNVTEYDN